MTGLWLGIFIDSGLLRPWNTIAAFHYRLINLYLKRMIEERVANK